MLGGGGGGDGGGGGTSTVLEYFGVLVCNIGTYTRNILTQTPGHYECNELSYESNWRNSGSLREKLKVDEPNHETTILLHCKVSPPYIL